MTSYEQQMDVAQERERDERLQLAAEQAEVETHRQWYARYTREKRAAAAKNRRRQDALQRWARMAGLAWLAGRTALPAPAGAVVRRDGSIDVSGVRRADVLNAVFALDRDRRLRGRYVEQRLPRTPEDVPWLQAGAREAHREWTKQAMRAAGWSAGMVA